jgi:hypothetical protein
MPCPKIRRPAYNSVLMLYLRPKNAGKFELTPKRAEMAMNFAIPGVV